MVRGLLQTLGYVADEFESPVQWQCRSCEAEVSPDGVVAHTQFCVVGMAERLLGGDPTTARLRATPDWRSSSQARTTKIGHSADGGST